MTHRTFEELTSGLEHVRAAPADRGTLEMIVRRPEIDNREIVDSGYLDLELGLVGDNWKERGNARTPDGSADPLAQLTVMGARAAALIAGENERWSLAGDQLFVDLDVSDENLPPGSRLAIGDAVVEISPKPHNGCAKFSARFGEAALKFVNSGEGHRLRMRGRNAWVVTPGTVRRGDSVSISRA